MILRAAAFPVFRIDHFHELFAFFGNEGDSVFFHRKRHLNRSSNTLFTRKC